MGVPRLFSNLTPYGEKIVWRSSDLENGTVNANNVQNVIIDGPSLVYHVYGKCMQARPSSPVAHIDTLPSYAEVAKTTVTFLNDLETYGLYIKHVFFDGVLPPTKRPTRLERLHKYLEQLTAFRLVHSRFTNPRAPAGTYTPFDTREPRGNVRTLPVSGLLVPAVLDTLFASDFADRTAVVPCEADVACAAPEYCAKDDVVLTNDSDMVVLQPLGGVAFFHDLYFTKAESSGGEAGIKELQGTLYQPQKLTEHLGCTNFLDVAFYLKQDPARTLKECAALALKKHTLTDAEELDYANFRKDYNYSISAISDNAALRKVCRRLDPRISELVHEVLIDPQTQPSLYLPFLIDDPTRASPWQISSSVRRMAYSILLYARDSRPSAINTTIDEHDRRGERILPLPVQPHPSSRQLAHACNALAASMQQYRQRTAHAPRVEQWRIMSIMLTLNAILDSGRPVPLPTNVNLVFTSEKTMLWEHVYISAQCEGMIASLRMLRQMLDLYSAVQRREDSFSDDDRELAEALGSLRKCLEDMPPLYELLSVPAGKLLVEKAKAQLDELLDEFFGVSGEDGGQKHLNSTEEPPKKRKKKAQQSGSKVKPNTRQSDGTGNIYDVLSEES